jgi:hypothetical protein
VVYESALEKFHYARACSLRYDEKPELAYLENRPSRCAGTRRCQLPRLVIFSSLLVAATGIGSAQTQPTNPASSLPDAPLPIIKHGNSKSGPCRVIPKSESAGIALSETGSGLIAAVAGFPPIEEAAPSATSGRPAEPVSPLELPPCPLPPLINFYQRFINGPEVKPLTPKEKARLAVKNLLDPFNAVTILANAAIAVGSDSHSDYGPGMHGFAKVVGVSYSEDLTGEFFGTFLIPSIVHQDPHYHRMPNATIRRRIFHAISQVGWTQGDNGKGMVNYANLLGFPIDAEIANLYVPGEKTNLPSTSIRVAAGLAIAPTDNFVTEFLPDIARRIHVRIVLVQEIINQVARTEPAGSP